MTVARIAGQKVTGTGGRITQCSTIATAIGPPTRQLLPAVPTVPIYRLSVAQYEAIARQGILGPEDRVELINGWLVPKAVKTRARDRLRTGWRRTGTASTGRVALAVTSIR